MVEPDGDGAKPVIVKAPRGLDGRDTAALALGLGVLFVPLCAAALA